MVADLLDLLEYNRWATRRLLDAAAELTRDAYVRDLGSSYPSVQATLEQMLGAESFWLSGWRGDPLRASAEPVKDDGDDVPGLGARWEALWRKQADFLRDAPERELTRRLTVRMDPEASAELTLAETIRHVVDHASYHRGQVTTLLRQLGATPLSSDLHLLYAERAPGRP